MIAARINGRRFSAARKRAARKCCQGAELSPYQASLVTVTRVVAPARTASATSPGKVTSKQMATPSRSPAQSSSFSSSAGVKSPALRASRSRKGKSGASGTYSPNGTRCRLS